MVGGPPHTYSGFEDSLSRLAGRSSISADTRRLKIHAREVIKEVDDVK